MKLSEVHEAWIEDSKIDRSELGNESLRTPSLSAKWLRTFGEERMVLKKMETAYKVLRHAKLDFYVNGPSDVSRKQGWVLPSRGKILKTEANGYVDVDPDVISASEIIAEQVEVVDAVEGIIKIINNRGFAIKNALEWLRFTNGG